MNIKFNTIAKLFYLFSISFFAINCNYRKLPLREELDLSGFWKFQIDSGYIGNKQKWYLSAHQFNDSIKLPGTTDISKKGFFNTDTLTSRLHRNYKYEGAAWYTKDVSIPAHWNKKNIELIIERTKISSVWIDGKYIGSSTLLQSKQVYDLTKFLSAGKHSICVLVNNSLKLTNYGNVHIYSDETATNWNGMIGELKLVAKHAISIKDIQLFTDINKKTALANITITNIPTNSKLELEYQVFKIDRGDKISVATGLSKIEKDSSFKLNCSIEKDFGLWDDYDQNLYQYIATIKEDGKPIDEQTVYFGFRKFEAKQTNFYINDRKTFLRGKHDGCVFPLTGHPPMDTTSWIKLFRTAKQYGINHYRFHTWCPPEAAFTAADHEGIFLQIELPFWGSEFTDITKNMLLKEALAMQKNYANHPSLTMFAMGNELWTNEDTLTKFMGVLKASDKRMLYTQSSNHKLGSSFPSSNSDFHVTVRTPYIKDTTLYHTRLTFWYGESDQGGLLNKLYPNTRMNFDSAVAKIKIPMISHEIGQFLVFPDYDEIKKYTGVVKAKNLEIFQNRLKKSGMLGLNKYFQKASGALAVICYKAEIEAALRTSDLAGFQLLDLQDYPGQGTALVGILDAFMDSKNIVTPKEWRYFCNDVVPLALFNKYCWGSEEIFETDIQVANYSNKDLNSDLNIRIVDANENILFTHKFTQRAFVKGSLSSKLNLKFNLQKVSVPKQLRLEISIANTNYKNSYPFWVYPRAKTGNTNKAILVSTEWDKHTIKELEQGGKVLYLPQSSRVKSSEGMFNSEFWSYGMFKHLSKLFKKPFSPGTMGLLIDNNHPIFNDFPTEYHSNWQWWSIIKNSNFIPLKNTDEYLPIVQVIDNFERNQKLGLIFEWRVGKGSLLVCSSRLNKIQHLPEGRQLYASILNYMNSRKFNPQQKISTMKIGSIVN